MATTSTYPLRTVKTKDLLNKTKNDVSTTKKPIDPFQKRLNHIRIHILNNKKQPKLTHAEPTLVFDQFLYLGGLQSLQDKVNYTFLFFSFLFISFSNHKTRLTRRNITHILSVVWIRPKADLIPSNIKHLFLKADDSISFNMSPYFDQACEFIEQARQSNGRILVHCACGVSRSTTLCCAYLIKHHSMSVEQAITHLRARRHIVQPNPAFLEQLIRYNEKIESDNKTMNEITEQLENV
jgi:protein-tyrosine phosphatase